MYISTKDWTAFVNKLSKINQTAADLVREYVMKNGFGDTQALIGYCYEVASQYGAASATLAALMYDAITELEGQFYPPAELASGPTFSDVAKSVNGTLKTSQNADSIAGAVSRLVKMSGQDTLLYNAIRDRAEWAWIPSGDTCAFCLTLASKGWQPASESALSGGHAEHIHGNCDCTYMIRHRQDVNVRGYDPAVYRRLYDNADGSGSKEKINSIRRMQYASNKDRINAQKREAYALRQEEEDA